MAKTAEKREHNAIPWHKIRKMYEAGASMEKIARATGYFEEGTTDPTHQTRGQVARGSGKLGYTDSDGNKAWFDRKEREKALVAMGKTPRGKKVATKKVKVAKVKKAKTIVAKGKPGRKPKNQIAILLDESHNFVKVALNGKKILAPVGKLMPQLVVLMNDMGLKLIHIDGAEYVAPVEPEIVEPQVEAIPEVTGEATVSVSEEQITAPDAVEEEITEENTAPDVLVPQVVEEVIA